MRSDERCTGHHARSRVAARGTRAAGYHGIIASKSRRAGSRSRSYGRYSTVQSQRGEACLRGDHHFAPCNRRRRPMHQITRCCATSSTRNNALPTPRQPSALPPLGSSPPVQTATPSNKALMQMPWKLDSTALLLTHQALCIRHTECLDIHVVHPMLLETLEHLVV